MKIRYQWTDYFAAFSIVVGATLSCVLCYINENAGACIGVLLVFGMALFGVLVGRSVAFSKLPMRGHSLLEKNVPHRTNSSKHLAPIYG